MRLAAATFLLIGGAGSVVVLAITLQTGWALVAGAAGWSLAAHPLAVMRATLLTGRMGTPEDIANVVALLAGRDGGWINGQVLRANGA